MISIKVDAENLQAIDQAAASMERLNSAGGQGNGTAGSEGGMFCNLISGAADAYGAIQIVTGALSQAGGLISQYNELGVSSLRAKEALSSLAGGPGGAATMMDDMKKASSGLVDNMSLAQAATQALSTGVVNSSADMATLVKDGTALGMVFEGSASQGISDFTRALEMVGSTRALKTLGIDAVAVKTEFDDLKKSGMDAASAWREAMFDNAATSVAKLGDVTSSTGTALERLNADLDNLKQKAGETIAIKIEAAITTASQIGTISDAKGAGYLPAMLLDDISNRVTAILNDAVAYKNTGKSAAGNMDMPGSLAGYGSPMTPEQQAQLIGPYGGALDYSGAGSGQGTRPNYPQPAITGMNNPATGLDAVASNMRALSDDAGIYAANIGKGAQHASDMVQGMGLLGAAFHDAENTATGFVATLERGVEAIRKQVAGEHDYQTIQAAFGLGNGGIAGQLEGQLGTDAAYLEKRVGGSKRTAVSAADKQVIDDYRIASGQATEGSIALESAQQRLSDSARAGRISLADEAQGLLDLATAARAGKTSVEDMNNIALARTNPQAYVMKELNDPSQWLKQSKAAPTEQDDPFSNSKKSADEYKGKIEAIGTAMTGNIAKAVASGAGIAVGNVLPILSYGQLNDQTVAHGRNMQNNIGKATDMGNGIKTGMKPAHDAAIFLNAKLDYTDALLTKLASRTVSIVINATGNAAYLLK